jgi:tetratricopeptide (TPR) repeat protein
LVAALASLGAALTNAGELERAAKLLEEARDMVRDDDRPGLALVLTNLVVVYQERGDNQRAFATAEQALAVERAAKGDEHADVGRAYFNVGDTLLSLGRRHAAIAPLRRAIAIWEHALPHDHWLLKVGRSALARATSART